MLRSRLLLFVVSSFLLFSLIAADVEPKEDPDEGAALPIANNPTMDSIPSKDIPELEKKLGSKLTENVGFIHAFVASFSVILVSEIGDKTFFIAAIMAMRHPRLTVFSGAIFALVLMTILSALFGWIINVIPRAYTYYISTALFAFFGLKMLKEGCAMSPNEGQEELEEVHMDIMRRDESLEEGGSRADPETGSMSSRKKQPTALSMVFRIFLQAFTLTFLAEWGDRSQLTTIILGARENVYGVILGGSIGHSICTGVAVLGGRMIAAKISVRTVTIIGGIVFLLFAFSALFFDPNSMDK